jgi:hypothetical protein
MELLILLPQVQAVQIVAAAVAVAAMDPQQELEAMEVLEL